ncbi:MFS transporter [Streptomyces diastatochromogenes]|nr:MFS transporter [Streptomyces diastatochromogenes]
MGSDQHRDDVRLDSGDVLLLRFLLGVFEAGFYPGIILFLTYWFPNSRRSKAFGMFMSASAFAGALGGPVAGWIMTSLDGVNGLEGWQWVFVIEGIPSVLAGLVTWFYLSDRPEDAKWLTPRQRELVLADIAREDSDLGPREHSMLAILRQGRIWQFIAIFFCIIMANSAQTFFAPTIIKEIGYDSPVAIGWIMAFAYVLGGIGMIYNGFHSDRHHESRRHCALAAALGSASFAAIALTIDVSPVLTLVALTLAIIGTMSAIPVFWQMPNRFLAGAAAAGGIALINSLGNLAGFSAPYMLGTIKDSTGSLAPGLGVVAVFEIAAAVLVLLCVPKIKKAEAPAPAQQKAEATPA